MKPLLLAFAALVPGAVAQSFTVPSTWRKPTSSRSLSELTGIAQAADDSIKPYLNATTGLLSNFYYFNTIATAYSSLARKDRLAGTQSNKWIVNAIKTANSTYNGFSVGYSTTTWIGWGIAATDAYKAYGDPSLLQIAYGTWNSIAQYQITESQAQAGSHPLKNYTFVSECKDKTVAGGVFGNTNFTGSIWLYSQTASYFAQFSALLADVETSQGRDNTKYKNAGLLSANFLLNQLVDPSSLVMNTLIINGTTACAVGSKTWSENTAHAMEAFAVLAGVTGDSKWSDVVSQTVATATTTSSWVGNDGVVVNDSGAEDEWDKIAKGLLLASLYEPWARTKNSAMKSYIAAFVNVQQNALLDLATSGSSGFYSSDWHGPAASSFTPEGMTAAMCLATTSIAVNSQSPTTSNSQSSSATSSSPSTGPTEPAKSDSKSLAVPLGAGLGAGIPVLLLALLGLFFLCRRRRNTGSEPDNEKFDPQTQQHYPALDLTPYAAPTDPQPTSAYAPSTDIRSASSYVPPTDVQSHSPYAPPTDIQPYSPYASPPVAPVPMPSPPPTSVPSPPPGRIEFATAPSGKETMYTWQGNQQPDPAAGSGVASGYGANQIPAEHIPTDDLVRILNDRVSRGYEPQGDGPPVYLENNR